MRDIILPDIAVYFLMVVAFVSVMGTILSGPIAEWLNAREDRKNAEAAAKSAGGSASPAAAPSTVAPSTAAATAPPTTPEPA
ncbi:MAG: hypothetical protein OXU98_02585 [Gammaproteobacteria bacterium]|nr:hypothetical protein [Gammaproteobacteria bacterium]